MAVIMSWTLVLIYCLICNARVGLFCMLAFVLLVFWSLVKQRLIRRFLKADFRVDAPMGERGKTLRAQLLLENPLPFYTLPLMIRPAPDNPWKPDMDAQLLALPPFAKRTVELRFTVPAAGAFPCGPEKIEICGLYGYLISSLSLPMDEGEIPQHCLGILPEYELHGGADPELEEMMSIAAGAANGAQEKEMQGRAFSGGYPGYDTRKYEPGDSLKKIHSKLSARQGELLVRLDEPLVRPGMDLLIWGEKKHLTFTVPKDARTGKKPDSFLELLKMLDQEAPEDAQDCLASGRIVDRTMQMAAMLLSREIGCTVYYPKWSPGKVTWKADEISQPGDLEELSRNLAFYRWFPRGKECRIPAQLQEKRGTQLLVFARHLSEESRKMFEDWEAKGENSVQFLLPEETERRAQA